MLTITLPPRLAAVLIEQARRRGVSAGGAGPRRPGAAFKVFVAFGGQKAPPERLAHFAALRERFRKGA